MDRNFYWLLASMVFIGALFTDCALSFYYFEEWQRVPFFVNAVFGQDMVLKLETAALFCLLIIGCEVSE